MKWCRSPKAKLGTWDTELAEVFFDAFARTAQCNLHLKLPKAKTLHHIVEITLSASSKKSMATEKDPRVSGVLTTKGSLTNFRVSLPWGNDISRLGSPGFWG
ncbi:MAG: hypothetical protein R3B07_27250 [Polyangiaceae bacterium]